MGSYFPNTSPNTDKLTLSYQLDKLYQQAFPSVANMALYKFEGVKDLAKEAITNLIGWGFHVPIEGENQNSILDFTGIQIAPITEENAKSYLGTPIFFPMKLNAGTYNILQNGKVVSKTFANDLVLPATSTAEFSRSKIIARTDINGQEGSVKEQWGFSDWDITIRGLVLTERLNLNGANSMVFPDEELSGLLKYEELADSIEVSGKLFEILRIKRICILKISISQVSGSPNAIPFVMTCISDRAAELVLQDNKIIQQ